MILKEKLILDDALLKWAQPLTYTAVKCKICILRNLLQLSHSSKNYRRSYKRKTLTGIILLQNEHIYFSYFHTFSNRTYIIFESRTFTCGRELSQRVIGAFTCRKVIFGVLFLMWYSIVLVRLLNKKKSITHVNIRLTLLPFWRKCFHTSDCSSGAANEAVAYANKSMESKVLLPINQLTVN